LAHPQLSIREYAIQAFDSFLQRSKYQETLDSFLEVVSRLLSNVISSDSPTKLNGVGCLKETETPWLLDPYESEALLGVCSILVKNTSGKNLMIPF
jgi:hypothetical protein